jgi:hypothetical protein
MTGASPGRANDNGHVVIDASWDVMPVANPDLPSRKRRKLVDHAVMKDPLGIEEPEYQLRDREKVVVPSTLDRGSRELLLRVQRVIAVALDADDDEIGSHGAVPEATLLQHEWEIAVALRDITDLRAEHGMNVAASVGPMTKAVLESHDRALRQAQEAITGRVGELERYASCVNAAAIAYRDWQDALRVSELNDRYLDLVARTAADEYAIAEISGLTERAETAARTFRETVQQVSMAAAALELREPRGALSPAGTGTQPDGAASGAAVSGSAEPSGSTVSASPVSASPVSASPVSVSSVSASPESSDAEAATAS